MADIYDQQIADLDRLGEADADEEDAEMMESEAAADEEPLNEWIRRTNLLAGTGRG
jgi:hypothetical protein